MAATAQKLSPIQVHLLRFFSEKNVTEQETQELQKLIAKYYAEKADNLMEDIWHEKQYDETRMFEILEQDLKNDK